ncbi:putative chitinase 10 [Andrena cerasifolii]|uniref:putative chitinase 10 n=1 Tax=Andrena cerasifolii TaxID=2819439 RepID=UPI004037B9D9
MASTRLSTILLCTILCAVFLLCGLVNGEVIPYPGDCTKYQHCDGSGCFILSCGAGTEFNPNIGTCDYPLQNRRDCNRVGYI